MNPVKPKDPTTPGWTATTYAKDQPEYLPLDVVRKFDEREGKVISVWEPDATELELLKTMIANGLGVRISLELWTFRQPYPPMRMVVGYFPEPYQGIETERFESDGIGVEEVKKEERPHWSEVINQPPVQDGEE